MCSENCLDCIKFKHDTSKIKLKFEMFSDEWFLNLFDFLETIVDARKYTCPDEYKLNN